MKRGFTLIELLAVIVILAIIALIATPIVLDIIEDSKKSSNKRSLDMYVKAVENAVATYELNSGKSPNNFDDIEKYIKYDGSEINCEIERLYKDGTIYLDLCKIDGNLIEDYSYGEKIGNETLARTILDSNGGEESIAEITDFSGVTVDGEYGLYKMDDDLGISYYFRGDVENNYVAFGPKEYQETYSPLEIDDTVLEGLVGADLSTTYKEYVKQLVFGTVDVCKTIGEDMGNLWTTCEKKENVNRVYVSDGFVESYIKTRGIMTEEACIAIAASLGYEITSCEEKTIQNQYENSMYWRIIRINGDGTIRLAYDGSFVVKNGIGKQAVIGSSEYNKNHGEPKHVGYTYDDNGVETDSTIKSVLDNWYESNLEENYGKYISDSIFCNDRTTSTTSEGYLISGAYTRLKINNTPILTCEQKEDRYTISDLNGNGLLTKPIGLITADELVVAGSVVNNVNNTNYLYSGNWQWTMTPSILTGSSSLGTSFMFYLGSSGSLFSGNFTVAEDGMINSNFSVRPVINLKADVRFTGTGTLKDPYIIITD